MEQPALNAKHILRAAVRAITDERATAFEYLVAIEEQVLIRVAGHSRVDSGWRATTTFPVQRGDEDTVRMLVRSVAGSVWMQMTSWTGSDSGCWLLMPQGQVPVGLQAMTPVEPAYISVVAGLHASEFATVSGDTIHGEMDLQAATTLVNAKLFKGVRLRKGQLRGGRVPVTVKVEAGRLSRVELSGSNLLIALTDAGVNVVSRASQALDDFDITLSYPATSSRLPPIKAPPTHLAVAPGSAEDGCRSQTEAIQWTRQSDSGANLVS